MTHPNQVQPRRAQVSRAQRPAPFPRYVPHPAVVTRRRGRQRKIRFTPDPGRLSGVLPPGVRVRRPLGVPARMPGDERIAGYAAQSLAVSGGRAVKTALTPAQRSRVASKGRMSAGDRARL